MLRIRGDQLDALESGRREGFLRQLVEHTRMSFPERTAGCSDELLLARLRSGTERAATHGLTDQRSVALFVDVQTGLDPAFDERPELREELEYRALPADRRMARVLDKLRVPGEVASEQLAAAGRSACATFEVSPIDDVVMPCERTTLEIELLDADGRGVPREPVWIGRLPALHVHEIIETRLDADGRLVLTELAPGDYLVRFPRREHQEADIRTWVSFRLEDDRGQPLAFEPFRVLLADGAHIDATRDDDGALHANGTRLIPGRGCAVTTSSGDGVLVTLDAVGEEVRLDHVVPGEIVVVYPDRETRVSGHDPYAEAELERETRGNA